MFKINLTKETLSKLQQDLLFTLLEKDLHDLCEQNKIMSQKLLEWKRKIASIEKIDKTISLKEEKPWKTYSIYVENIEVIRFYFLTEKEQTKKLIITYYDYLKELSRKRRNLEKEWTWDFLFKNSQITVMKVFEAYSYKLKEPRYFSKEVYIRRYLKDTLITEETFDILGLSSRYYNLDGHQVTEDNWSNTRVPSMSRNRFNKQYKNALALTKVSNANSKEISENSNQKFLKELLEGDLLSLKEPFEIMKEVLQEFKIEFGILSNFEKTISLEESENTKKYFIYVNDICVARFNFFKEKDCIRALDVYYYDDLELICRRDCFLEKQKHLEFKFFKPNITILTAYNTSFCLWRRNYIQKEYIGRYEGNDLRTKEQYDYYGLRTRYYNLGDQQAEEDRWLNHRIPEMPRNNFDKHYEKALALTKERKL